MKAKVLEHPSSARGRQCKKLADVLSMTGDMLAAAREGNWELVADMETERRGKMGDCFDFQFAEDSSGLIAEAIAAILHLNDELMTLLQASRKEVMEQSQQVVRAREAVGSYLKTDKVAL
jgi:hypothetical protein